MRGFHHFFTHVPQRPWPELKTCLNSKRLISSHIPLADPKEKYGYDHDVASNVHWINLERHKRLGPIYYEELGPDVSAVWTKSAEHMETILRNDGRFPKHVVPEAWRVYNERNHVQRGLFFMDGKQWWTLRRRLNPIFMTSPSVEQAVEHAAWVTDELINRWQDQIDHDQEQGTSPSEILELEEQLSVWSLSFALSSLFGSNFEGGFLEFGGLTTLNDTISAIFQSSAQLQTLSAHHEAERESGLWTEFSSAVSVALETVRELVHSQAAHCTDGLVHAMRTQGGVSDVDQLSILVSDLILAAIDTSAISVLWTLYCLSESASVQDSLVEQSVENRAELVKCSIRESMRLHPFAPFLTRILDKEVRLDEKIVLPKDTLVLLSIFAAGRDEEYFTRPNQFWPKRWMREKGSRKMIGVSNHFASLPFGHGVRSCIGRKVAEEQISYLLTQFFTRFKANCLNDNEVRMKLRLVGVPDSPIRIAIKNRECLR